MYTYKTMFKLLTTVLFTLLMTACGGGSGNTTPIINTPNNSSGHLLYATKVLGYSSQYSVSSWSANQVLGQPNTHIYGDKSTAWAASRASHIDNEWISVSFSKSVYSIGVTIRESYGNGFVTKIETIDEENNLRTVWQGIDDSEQGIVVDFSVGWEQTMYLTKGIKITINPQHSTTWEEIDSIALHNGN